MRHTMVSKMLVFGAAALTYKYLRQHRRREPAPRDDEVSESDMAADPSDPVQGFDEASKLVVSDLDVDALDLADAEAAQDLAALDTDAVAETEYDESIVERDTLSQVSDAIDHEIRRDLGELYGMHTPPAVDRSIPDEVTAMEEGQNWMEALESSAAEYGAEPEHTLDPTDETDLPPHPSDTRDIPVADRGSGGRGGL